MKTEQEDEIEAWLDSLDPATIQWKDAAGLRRLIAAQKGMDAAEKELRAAVREAHEYGLSWAAIGGFLGVSKQAAHRRFAQPE
jgi:hypothetical protein